jgi:hypothetical protein
MRWSASQAVSFFVPSIKAKVDFASEEGTGSEVLGSSGRITCLSGKARNVDLHRNSKMPILDTFRLDLLFLLEI